MNSPSHGTRNRLLAVLSIADRYLLAQSLEAVELDLHQVLETPNVPISHLYFVERGLASIVCEARPYHRIEVGMVGYEGMTGSSIVLGDDRSTNRTLVQSAGSALRISTRLFRGLMDASPTLSAIMLRSSASSWPWDIRQHLPMVAAGWTSGSPAGS